MVIQVKQDWAQLLRFTLITGKLGGRCTEVKVTEILQPPPPNSPMQLMGPPVRFLGNLKESVKLVPQLKATLAGSWGDEP